MSRIYNRAAWKRIRLEVLADAGYRCQVLLPGCLGRADRVDHRVALADGGSPYDRRNLRAACDYCNSALAARRTNRIRKAKRRPPGPSSLFEPPSREW